MPVIRLEDVSKIYAGNEAAIRNLSLEIEDGEFIVLVGPSGSGKSTVLKVLAGLTKVSSGRVSIGGSDVTSQPPQSRDVAMVFQNYALYPHMTVRANLGFGLRMRHTSKEERKERIEEVARMLGIMQLLDRFPAALSGGERQRVAMGRAIVRRPKAFLMDEPLSNLDAKLRVQLRAELVQLRERLRTTTVYVTHDQVEAMTLGERVAVLCEGVLQQVGSPRALYERPINMFVATFIGSPRMNLFPTILDSRTVRMANWTFAIPAEVQIDQLNNREVVVGVRPSSFEVDEFSDPDWPRLEALVRAIEDLGSEKVVIFDLEGMDEGPFQARVNVRASIWAGARLRLALDPEEMYFFDPATQRCIGWPSPLAPTEGSVSSPRVRS
jgi:multiple sugar transport system ATP-binding protein